VAPARIRSWENIFVCWEPFAEQRFDAHLRKVVPVHEFWGVRGSPL
jgi:hypothetical protein